MSGRSSISWKGVLLVGAWAAGGGAAAPNLEINAWDPGADQARIAWSAIPGHQYALWAMRDLSQPGSLLEGVPNPWIAQSDTLSHMVVTTGSAGYYRVVESEDAIRSYHPPWAGAGPSRILTVTYDDRKTSVENGALLKAALQGLQPGDRLEVGSGVFSLDSYTLVDLQGTESAPIWVVAATGSQPVITRPNAQQNIVNVGVNHQARYLCFRGLEFTGGSHGIRLYDCTQVWVDQCRIHDTGGVALSANARDTSHLFITRNEIWNPGGTAEGMYLGANEGAVIMSESVIALNHVHDTFGDGSQGDGIEVKQGSWGNWIVENHIHDCHYPCLLVYGTAGRPENIVERNICYRSNDNTMQIQGEAMVRNNLAIGGGDSAFASGPHQGDPTRLTVVHNTFINTGRAVRLTSWELGAAMVFANNACYSREGEALTVFSPGAGTEYVGNVCFGGVTAGVDGHQTGESPSDFRGVTWDGRERDARPAAGSVLIGAADPTHGAFVDLAGVVRIAPHSTGCYAP